MRLSHCACCLLQTPKYGLIYHASLVGQTAPKNKGKIRYLIVFERSINSELVLIIKCKCSRVLAAKCSLAIRVDALSDEKVCPIHSTHESSTAQFTIVFFSKSVPSTIGQDSRVAVEQRVRMLEGGVAHQLTGSSKGNDAVCLSIVVGNVVDDVVRLCISGKSGQQSYSNAGAPLAATYNASADSTLIADKQKKEKKEVCSAPLCCFHVVFNWIFIEYIEKEETQTRRRWIDRRRHHRRWRETKIQKSALFSTLIQSYYFIYTPILILISFLLRLKKKRNQRRAKMAARRKRKRRRKNNKFFQALFFEWKSYFFFVDILEERKTRIVMWKILLLYMRFCTHTTFKTTKP